MKVEHSRRGCNIQDNSKIDERTWWCAKIGRADGRIIGERAFVSQGASHFNSSFSRVNK